MKISQKDLFQEQKDVVPKTKGMIRGTGHDNVLCLQRNILES